MAKGEFVVTCPYCETGIKILDVPDHIQGPVTFAGPGTIVIPQCPKCGRKELKFKPSAIQMILFD